MEHREIWPQSRSRPTLAQVLSVGFVIALSMSAVTSRAAAVPDFPARPIRLICPFAPGGGNDIFSRSIAEPDGYTLVMASSTLSINATLYPKLPYDSVKSFAPVSLAVSTPLVVAVNASSPMKTIADLIAAAKAKPGQIMYPSAGIGNSTHLAGELLAAMARIDLNHVPYKGSLPGITEVIAGRLHVVFPTLPSAKPHLNSGRLRALAVTSSKRASSLPDVPTVAESELAGYEVSTWYGVLATGGTPRRIVMALHSEIVKALVTPEVRKAADAQGLEVVGNTPEQFAAYVQAEIGKWAKVIKTAGVKVE